MEICMELNRASQKNIVYVAMIFLFRLLVNIIEKKNEIPVLS